MRVGVLLKLSARSVGRNARRSMLTAAAMVIGLALLILSRALASGTQRITALLVSDVRADDVGTIGSGPTAPDATTFGDGVRRFTVTGSRPRFHQPAVA